MKKRIFAALLSLCLVVGLLPATALAADNQPATADSQGISKSTYDVYNEKDFLHVLASFNSDSNKRLSITVHNSFTLNEAIDIINADIILKPNVTLTVNAAIKINGNCSIKGIDSAGFDESNVTMTSEPTAVIKRGANTMLFLVERNATLSTSNVIIDGGAEWCTDETCTDPRHIATTDVDLSQTVSSEENATILANINRQIHNKGMTSDNTLIQVDGRFNGANIVFQNTAYDKVQGEGAVVYVNGNVYLTNTVMRNCQTARGRAVGFYGWGVLEITNFEAYGNMLEWGRGQNCGVIFTDWGFNLDLNNANIHNNACSRSDRGIISGNGATKFNSGKVADNYTNAFHTHYGSAFQMNGGEFTRNRTGIAYMGSSYEIGGSVYLNGGKVYGNNANIIGNGRTNLYLNGGELEFINGDYCSGNIYFGGNDTPLIIGNPDIGERGYWSHDRRITGPLSEGSQITLKRFDDSNYISGENYTITDEDFKKFVNQTGKNIYLDKTSNAIYSGCEIKITLDANGGTLDVDSVDCSKTTLTKYYPVNTNKTAYTSKYGEMPIPTKQGAFFAGWYTEEADGEQVTEESVLPRQAEVTLYAHWTTNLAECTRATDYTGIFDGMAHSIQVITAEGATIQYSEEADGTYKDTNPEYTNAGTYTVYYKVNKEGCTETSGSATVTIDLMDIGGWGQNRIYSYTGNELTRKTSDKFDEYFNISGTERATEPGEYLMTCTVKDKYVGNIKWSVSNDSNSFEWTKEGSAAGNYPTQDNQDTMVLRWAITGGTTEDESKEDVKLSFKNGTENNTTSLNDSYENIATGAPNGSTITYSSNKPYVATVNEEGIVTPVSVGMVKITASYSGDETHNAASASYWLTITSNNQEYHCVIEQTYTAPTCEDVGYTEGKVCSACGQVFSGIEPISAKGHDYQYTASNNVITGTCNHDTAHVITATLNAPSSEDGEATITYSEKWPEDAQNLEIRYTTSGSNKTASITYNGQTARITYSGPVRPGDSSGNSTDGSSGNTTTTTSKNPDGSTTTTVTNKTTGVTTETTKAKDGTTVVETTDKKGNTTVTANVPAAAINAAEGEAVTLPTTLSKGDSVKITTAKESKVEIPVEKVTPGTVAVIVKADGTEEIVKTSVLTENGVALTLDGSATVKVIDNSKEFIDVPETNVFYNEVCALSAREIMVGKTENVFDLYNSVTLNQVANVAGRIVGAVDVKDYNAGIVWGAENGLKTGNVAATRGDVLKALYIAAGSPVVEDTSILSRFNDAASIPADLVAAAAWAAQNGILKGTADGTADLSANVTRGQACALAGRTMGTLA